MTAGTLRVEGLRLATRRHGEWRELVGGVDLTLAAGRVTALVGGSGCGKSLTCLGLQGLAPAGVERLGGRVFVGEAEVDPASMPGRVVATVMQNPRSAFNPVLSMRAHARETTAARGSHLDEAQLLTALREVGFAEPERVADLYPFQMSGGMLQRMMIALALLSEAPFLLADEPTTDLDPPSQAHILALIERLVARRKLGVLIVTHDMGVVARLASDVAVMDEGRIVETGPVQALFEAPRTAPARALLTAHLALYPDGD